MLVLQRLKCVVNERWLVLWLGKDIESTTKEAFYINCLEYSKRAVVTMFVPTHLDRGEGPHKRTILYVLYVCDAMECFLPFFQSYVRSE